jgi:UDP-glucose 4-epimerase
MKILLVGGNSTLALALRPALAAFADVVTAGRSGCDVMLDLAWPVARFELPTGLDTVIHLGASFGGQDVDAMLAAEEVNVQGALKLAHACKRAGVGHLVQISSIFAGLRDDSPFFNVYALSKRQGEELTQLYCRGAGLPLTILRPSQMKGDGESHRKHQPILYSLLDRAQRGEDIVLYGSNDAQRNFIHVDDVAEIIARTVRQRIEGLYTCANPVNVRFSEMAAAAVSAFGSTSTVRFDPSKADIADNAFAADESLYQRIGYFPTLSMSQGMAREAARRRALA